MPEKNPFYGATFAERQELRGARKDAEPEQVEPDTKQVDEAGDAENKAVKSASTKRSRKTAAKKS